MSAFFVRRPIVAIVLAIAMVLVGALSMAGLPIAQFPNVIPPVVALSATYTGADALTIESSVATPIEQQINGVDNMLYVKSVNASDGTMMQRVTFDVESNVDMDNVLVQNRYSQAEPVLPQAVRNYGVTIKKSLNFPLLVLAIYSPDGSLDASFLSNYATINIIDEMLRVRGVGDVRNLGASDYALRIWLKPAVLSRLGLTVADVQAAVASQNVVNPAGSLGAEPAAGNNAFTYTVRAQGRLVTPEEFGAILLRSTPEGGRVHLRDVAKVELGSLNYQSSAVYNGHPAGVLAVFQSPGSNALEVAENVRAALERLKRNFPQGMDYEVSLDTTLPVTEGIREIVLTLLEALALVALVTFVFLQNVRATVIPLLTVPVALVGAFCVFPWLGFSINTLSLFGLVLAVGLVVDDAIVVVEAVEHHLAQGLGPKQATLAAMREVTAPIVGVTAVLCAVFVPIATISGMQGRLYKQFALTIVISVLFSAVNALSLSPALCGTILRHGDGAQGGGPLARAGAAFNRGFDAVTHGYVAVSEWLIRYRLVALLFLAGTAAGAVVLADKIPGGFLPEEDNGYAIVTTALPEASSMGRTREEMKKVADIIRAHPGVTGTTNVNGFDMLSFTSSTYQATTFIALAPWDERQTPDTSARAIVDALNAKLAKLPGSTSRALMPPAIAGMGVAGGVTFALQDKGGRDVAFLQQQMGALLKALNARPEFAMVFPSASPMVPQRYVEVDKDRALQQGVALADIYATLQTFLGGAYINDFTRFGRQWRVYMEAEPELRMGEEGLGEFYVRNNVGKMVPLSSLASFRRAEGPQFTTRFNLFRAVDIIGVPKPGYSTEQAMAAVEEVADQVLAPDMGYAYTDLSYQQKITRGNFGRTLGICLIFVFLIMAALYESWSLPLVVLLTTPLAALGAYAGLAARGLENDVYAQIGLVMLVGLTAKNAILIVEFAEASRKRGTDLVHAALEGARLRLRPILMTTFAFVFGCAPLWVATGAGAAARRIMGTAAISGSLFATVVGVFLVPAFYVAIERSAERLFGRRRAADAAAAAHKEAT